MYCGNVRHVRTLPGNRPVEPRLGRECIQGAFGMREWLLLTTIMVAGFGFTLGKLAYDEWQIKRNQRNHGTGA